MVDAAGPWNTGSKHIGQEMASEAGAGGDGGGAAGAFTVGFGSSGSGMTMMQSESSNAYRMVDLDGPGLLFVLLERSFVVPVAGLFTVRFVVGRRAGSEARTASAR